MKKTLLMGSVPLAIAVGFCLSWALVHANPQTAAVSKDLPSYRAVIKQVLPAVVSIEVKSKSRLTQASLPPGHSAPFGNFFGLPDDLRKELERFQKQPPAQVTLGTRLDRDSSSTLPA